MEICTSLDFINHDLIKINYPHYLLPDYSLWLLYSIFLFVYLGIKVTDIPIVLSLYATVYSPVLFGAGAGLSISMNMHQCSQNSWFLCRSKTKQYLHCYQASIFLSTTEQTSLLVDKHSTTLEYICLSLLVIYLIVLVISLISMSY